jgi:polyprenyl P-hydroxybenzoate/phenylacrylic acid decarboxylase-like protein
MASSRKPVIVGISGATGSIYAIRLLERLKCLDVPTHLVVSKAAEVTLRHETGLSLKELRELASASYQIGDIGAAIASGSFETAGMIVAPCAIRTMAAIAHGLSDNLLTRAADVTLKERRKLILMLRETPFNLIHINAMKAITEAGGIIAPPVPAFYIKPTTIDDIVDHSVARAVDLLGIEGDHDIKRWTGLRNSTD